MLYFSQILGGRVEDSADNYVGRLKDILVYPEQGAYSPLVYLLIRGRGKNEYFIPLNSVENFSRGDISLKGLFSKLKLNEPSADEFIFLNRDVMDQQIVDLSGARVVRVNDLKFGILENKWHVFGIDVSVKGLLRRLGLAWLDFGNWSIPHYIDWRNVQPVKGVLKLDKITKNLNKLHPADLANVIEKLNLNQSTSLVKSLDSREAAKVIEELDPHLQKLLISRLGPEKAAKIIEKMSIDELVDLMQLLPKHEADAFLHALQDGKLKKIEHLINYAQDTAGGLMNTDYISGVPDWTAQETIAEIRKQSPSQRSILFVYVINDEGQFLGPVSLRNLLLARPDEQLKNLLKPVSQISVLHPHNDLEHIVNMMTKYNLFSAAVVGDKSELLGVVSIDDVMRCLAPHA